MAFDYTYTRNKTAGVYDINNPDRVTTLAQDVEAALPGKLFKIFCDDLQCKLCFEVELTAGEQTTLDGVISDHQNNV